VKGDPQGAPFSLLGAFFHLSKIHLTRVFAASDAYFFFLFCAAFLRQFFIKKHAWKYSPPCRRTAQVLIAVSTALRLDV
jgi:hypothetical protein